MSSPPGKEVFIVEDDPDLCSVQSDILESEGYTVEIALNGSEALEHLRSTSRRPCLILLDLMMPVMNGWQFRSEQLRDPALAGIPVVITSADTNIHDKAASIHAAGYLQKPLRLEDLLDTVGRFCAAG